MKKLSEISKILLSINTRRFQKEDAKNINWDKYDVVHTLYKKDGITITLAVIYTSDLELDEDYEDEYLYASGLTENEKHFIETDAYAMDCNRAYEEAVRRGLR